MTNKIEEGCLAMVVVSSGVNLGKVGTVGKFLGSSGNISGDDVWEFSELIKTKLGHYYKQQNESKLMRINPDVKLDLTEDKERVNVETN
jgi:hypothetical protein